MNNAPSPADLLARQCADIMWANDRSSQALGMQIDHIAAGEAHLSMTVRGDMINGNDSCHGGIMFMLADSAFAFACNGQNQKTVAHHCSVTFVAPALEGDRLTAIARERHRAGRAGIYDATVTRQDGTVVAEFRGHSRTIKGTHVPAPEQSDLEHKETQG